MWMEIWIRDVVHTTHFLKKKNVFVHNTFKYIP